METLEIADGNILGIAHPRRLEVRNEASVLTRSISNPVNSPTLKEFIASHDSFLLVVNDQTRPTPTESVLDLLYDRVSDKRLGVVVATGSHRDPTQPELRKILGGYSHELVDKTVSHAAEKGSHVSYGRTTRGTEIMVNSLIHDFDGVMVIGSVEPHYFAGYTGGRKGIIPGISAYNSIEQNHSLALSPEAKALRLRGNPVHEDMEEFVQPVLKEVDVFCINIVIDGSHKTHHATSGHLLDSLYPAAERSKNIFVVGVEKKADIVVSVARPPFSINLYQAQKALDNAKHAVKENGTIILVASCSDGVGPRNFYDLLSSGETPQLVFEKIEEEYRLGYHKSAKIAEILTRNDVYAVTSLPPTTLERIFVKPFGKVGKALDEAMREQGREAEILFVMDGALTIPLPREQREPSFPSN